MPDLTADTLRVYLDHAFAGIAGVLDRLDNETVNERPGDWGTNTVAGLIVHCCELAPSWFATPGLGHVTTRNREAEFETTATISELSARIEATRTALGPLIEDFCTGPTATDHEYRVFLPGEDRSDAALALHVLEELFQHLGHMEVLADALGR